MLMRGGWASSLAGATSSRVHANLSRVGRLGRRDWDAGRPSDVSRQDYHAPIRLLADQLDHGVMAALESFGSYPVGACFGSDKVLGLSLPNF
jgi:hypothetical protein